jgi:hypothetical protein
VRYGDRIPIPLRRKSLQRYAVAVISIIEAC